jgi:hypothetical protein
MEWFIFLKFMFGLYPYLIKSSCWWLHVWSHHKIEKKNTTKHIKLTKLKKLFEFLTIFHVVSHFKHCPAIHILQFIPHEDIDVKASKVSNFNFFLISLEQYLFFFFFLVSFNKRIIQVCEDIMGPKLWEYI